jgi:selenoprotein W-related protein
MTRPRIEIHYCPRCHWLPRSAWMAQELLHTFSDELGEVALRPADAGGVFRILVDGSPVWERDGGFPGIRQLKQRVRDVIAPGRALGHLDR